MASQDGRRSASERGYGRRWQRERASYLALNPWCRMNGDGCGMLATLVDHVIPHRGDERLFWDVGNWQPLCDHCHSKHKQAIESGTAAAEAQRDHKGRLIVASRGESH